MIVEISSGRSDINPRIASSLGGNLLRCDYKTRLAQRRTRQEDRAMSYIYFVQMNIPEALDAELNRIYDTEHVPMLSKVPGVNRVSRYRLEQSNDSRMQKYMVIYEIASPAVTETKEWEAAGAYGDWATKIRPHTTSRHHTFFKKV